MRVLVVEDEKKTASFVRKALQTEGFAVDVLHDGQAVFPAVEHSPFDVVVLDIMLPGRDGLSILRQLRERSFATPVLLLTARGEVAERSGREARAAAARLRHGVIIVSSPPSRLNQIVA